MTTNKATIYNYRMPWGEMLRISADLTQAAAPIHYEGADEAWCSTPYQTADARHDETRMLALVVGYLGSEWYANPACDDDDETQLACATNAAVLVDAAKHEVL